MKELWNWIKTSYSRSCVINGDPCTEIQREVKEAKALQKREVPLIALSTFEEIWYIDSGQYEETY